MKRRSKIIATLVTLSLAMAMVVVGVYSATIVSFGISGSISYVVDDVFVNITTKVYTSDIVAHNPNAFNASLVQQYKDMLGLNAFASSELDNSVETLANTSISDIDTSKYTLVKSYTYSSLTEEGTNPITDLSLEFNSADAKTYFIVINIENLSSAPVYAVVQDDKNVPANTVELNNGLQQNILQGEKNRNIVFALGVVDFSRPVVAGSKFECGIKVGLGDISQTPENLAKLNIAYTDAVGGYTASIKQDAKGVVVVPSTAPEQTRATNDIIAMMPVTQVSSMDEMVNLINLGITHVYLPDTVSIIAPTAFTANVALTKIEGLDNVVSIGDYAFTACVNLAKIDLPDNCSSIGAYAFNNCANLYSVDIPENLTVLTEYMLSDCTSLKSIIIPDSVEIIGDRAFESDYAIEYLRIGDGVKEIGNFPFMRYNPFTLSMVYCIKEIYIGKNCSADFYMNTGLSFATVEKIVVSSENENICSQIGGVETNCIIEKGANNNLILRRGCKNSIIPYGITSLHEWAFAECIGLNSLELPNSVTEIGRSAFSGCTSIESITIPDSVTAIYDKAFENWNRNQSIYFEGISMPESLSSSWRDSCDANIYLNGVLQK